MNESILQFTIDYIRCLHIRCSVIDEAFKDYNKIDLGLRASILKLRNDFFQSNLPQLAPNAVFHVTDHYYCSYSLLTLPENEGFLIAGPYLLSEMDNPDIYTLIERLRIPAELFPQLQGYYQAIPFLSDRNVLHSLLKLLGTHLFGPDHLLIHYLDMNQLESLDEYLDSFQFIVPQDPILSMRLLEERYQEENALVQSVQEGNLAKVVYTMEHMAPPSYPARASDELREHKNRLIIFNTLLRRAAYLGGVHPFHIDAVSGNYACMIEHIGSISEGNDMIPFMVKTYCSLVEKRSMSSYSEPIQKILITIDASLTADLSLKRFSEELFLNPSYLSALFKKETGQTLTDFVNKTRIEYARHLLKSTKLSVQNIAAQSGIPDIHYFTRVFKRETGMSPREWRGN